MLAQTPKVAWLTASPGAAQVSFRGFTEQDFILNYRNDDMMMFSVRGWTCTIYITSAKTAIQCNIYIIIYNYIYII
jgi:hypothetical protein